MFVQGCIQSWQDKLIKPILISSLILTGPLVFGEERPITGQTTESDNKSELNIILGGSISITNYYPMLWVVTNAKTLNASVKDQQTNMVN